MPETFKKYDTTNHPNGKGLRVGKKIDKDDDSTIITKELIEEYKQATREQKELYGVVGWYDFNLQTFGCKWDCEVYVESEKDDEIRLASICVVGIWIGRVAKFRRLLELINSLIHKVMTTSEVFGLIKRLYSGCGIAEPVVRYEHTNRFGDCS